MNINEALSQLDPTNDDHWTNDGLPRLDAVSELTGSQVKRAEVTNANPTFSRTSSKEVIQSDRHDEEKGEKEEVVAPLTELELLAKKADKLSAALLEAQQNLSEWKEKADRLANETNHLNRMVDREKAKVKNHDTKNVRDYLAKQREVRASKAAATKKFFEETGTTPARIADAANTLAPIDAAMRGRKAKPGSTRPSRRSL